MTAAIGTLGKLGIGSSAPVTTWLDFQSEDVKKRQEIFNGNGVRGTRSHSVERTRPSLAYVGGVIELIPNAVELAAVLEWILGGTPSGTTYPLADTLPSRVIAVDRVTKVFSYTGCKIDKATFSCSQGEALSVSLDVVGIAESIGNAGTFPALIIDVTTGPFMFSDCVITVGGTAVTPKDISISISNFIDRERFFNSLTLASVETLDREIAFSCNLPYGDQSALYGSGSTGAEVVCTFTNGNTSLVMTMVKVVFPDESPNIPGRQEIMFPITGRAYKSGTTLELVTVLDSVP